MDKNRSQLRDEVTGLLLRGGLIGLVVFAAAVAYMAIPRQLGRIEPTVTVQTGFRGTGMNIPEFVADVEEQVAANALPDNLGGPVVPQSGDATVGEAGGALGHLTEANYDRLVTAMRGWVGQPLIFTGEDNYQTSVAERMLAMTWAINDEWSAHVGATGVTCYTCHRGNQVPLNVWFLPEPNSTWAGPYARYQNNTIPAAASVGTGMVSNYSTALPVDALAAYFLDPASQVNVHGYTSRDEDGSSNASIYKTYQTYNLMMHFSSSLGVNCTYCHNTRAPADPGGYTPQWATAQLGRQMVIDINLNHIEPTRELLPEARLGPLGDVAKVNCTTCHQGAAKPMLGQPMLPDWPELASPEPIYQ
jgi:photosynthetic reaction center cytochrome c subunit